MAGYCNNIAGYCNNIAGYCNNIAGYCNKINKNGKTSALYGKLSHVMANLSPCWMMWPTIWAKSRDFIFYFIWNFNLGRRQRIQRN